MPVPCNCAAPWSGRHNALRNASRGSLKVEGCGPRKGDATTLASVGADSVVRCGVTLAVYLELSERINDGAVGATAKAPTFLGLFTEVQAVEPYIEVVQASCAEACGRA